MIKNKRRFVSRNTQIPLDGFSNLLDGDSIHGLCYGEWSVIDAIETVVDVIGETKLVVATWAVGMDDMDRLLWLIGRGVSELKIIIDRSFKTRHPDYLKRLRDSVGDERIRVLNNHAKFYIFYGGAREYFYTTSANLNKNNRIENWSVFCVGDVWLMNIYLLLTICGFYKI